jgi:hypothetical protein
LGEEGEAAVWGGTFLHRRKPVFAVLLARMASSKVDTNGDTAMRRG